MLISKTAQVKWNAKTKRHYVDLGYHFTKMGDEFTVEVNDLTDGSNALVDVQCDYCGDIINQQWYVRKFKLDRSDIKKDCCKKCCELKANDAISSKFGSYADFYQKTNDRRKATNVERYGNENVFANDDIKKKIVNTNLQKYGVPYNMQNDEIRSKVNKTCMERYGVADYVELFRGKFIKENSPVWKGGVEASRVERATHEYVTWRKSVFARDHYMCQRCGAINGNGNYVELHAHHISNWADDKEQRYNIDNGSTLCSECHYLFHSIYGKRNNTLDQFNEFLNNRDKEIC